MNDNYKTKEQLIKELEDLRRRIAELEKSETEPKRAEEALKASEEKYRILVENAAESISIIQEGRQKFVNPGGVKTLGYPPEVLTSKPFIEFIHLDDREMVIERHIKRMRGEEAPTIYSFRVVRRDGVVRWVEAKAVVVPWKGKSANLYFLNDITERKEVEEELRKSEERYRTIIETIADGYYETDLTGNLTFFNDAFVKIFGYPRDELMRMHARDYTDAESARQLVQAFLRIYQTGESEKGIQYETISKNKTRRNVELSVSLIRDASGNPIGFRGILRDITERKEAEEALKTLSLKDDLTGLFNRRGFFTVAEQGLKTAQRMGTEMMLIFGDLDNLKGINDTFGHQEGDQALVDTSQILKETFRESDIIARIGGDEFVILAMNSFETSAEKLINRFEQVLNDHPLQTKRPYTLSLSLGLACFDPQNPCSIDVLLAQADKIMYDNKQKKGR